MNYIGIDIGATNLKAGLVDDRGRILATQKMKIVQIESPDALARNLARITQELAEEVGSFGRYTQCSCAPPRRPYR